jgi:hypothetical protein
MTRREVIALRRAWGRLPSVAGIGMRRIPSVPSPRPSAENARFARAEMGRLVELADLPDDLRGYRPEVAGR